MGCLHPGTGRLIKGFTEHHPHLQSISDTSEVINFHPSHSTVNNDNTCIYNSNNFIYKAAFTQSCSPKSGKKVFCMAVKEPYTMVWGDTRFLLAAGCPLTPDIWTPTE